MPHSLPLEMGPGGFSVRCSVFGFLAVNVLGVIIDRSKIGSTMRTRKHTFPYGAWLPRETTSLAISEFLIPFQRLC